MYKIYDCDLTIIFLHKWDISVSLPDKLLEMYEEVTLYDIHVYTQIQQCHLF